MKDIKAAIIIEMMGRPAEHLKEVMKEFLKKLDSENGIKITAKKIHEPKEVTAKDNEGKIIKIDDSRKVFCTFAEIDLEAKEIFDLIRIVFEYMPSHTEVIYPEEFQFQNFDFTTILNEITKKLHNYDAIAKNALMQNQMLANKIIQVQQAIEQGKIPNINISLKDKEDKEYSRKKENKNKKIIKGIKKK